jgi:formylglycine-generating enzyme required for sulfatase activity
MTSNNPLNCLIRQNACGLQFGQTECPKCGIRTDVRFVSQEDVDMAVAKGTALYWQNHAQALEQTLKAQEKVKREQLERAEIERAKADASRVQAQKEQQKAEARRAQEKAQREAAEQRAAQEKAKREEFERAEIERAKADASRVQAQNEKQEAEARRAQERAQREAAEQRAAQEKAKREELEHAEIERAKAESARAQAQKEKQEAEARRAQRNPGHVFQNLPITPQMVVLPSGGFLMGSIASTGFIGSLASFVNGLKNEGPQHKVIIAYQLAMGRYPVTFEEWDACIANGGIRYVNKEHRTSDMGWGRGKRPVINVSWNEVQLYIAWLNTKIGLAADDPTRYRLPSEAEWEYACRAGSQTKWCFGDDVDQLSEYALFGEWNGRTQPVGQKKANRFGLYDMHGNVKEWVEDWYHDDYTGAPSDGSAWLTGGNQKWRVLRGSHNIGLAIASRSASRSYGLPSNGFDHANDPENKALPSRGFRLARTLPLDGSLTLPV